MRVLLLTFAIAACAHSSAHYVNVATVRHEIADTLERSGTPHRSIVSMGHVTADLAVVYTRVEPSAPTQEETWVKQDGGWKLREAAQVAR